MIDAAPLAGLLLMNAAQTALVAGVAWLALRNVAAGSAQARLRFAVIAFYGAALLPLTMLLPRQVSVTIGPNATPLGAWQAPFVGDVGEAWRAAAIVFLAIAAFGICGRLVQTGIAVMRGERLRCAATPLDPAAFDLPAEVRIARSDTAGFAVAGLLQPTILLPARPEGARCDDLAPLLRHELSHLRRNDVRNALVQRIVEDLFWWNPAMRFLGRWLTEQREIVCDEIGADDKHGFARALLGEAQSRLAPALVASAAGACIERRIERLIARRVRSFFSPAALIVVLLALGAISSPRTSNDNITTIGIDSY